MVKDNINQLSGQIIKLTEAVYKLEGTVIMGFENNKDDHKVMERHFEKLNGQTEKNTNFRHNMRGAMKLSGVVVGSGSLIALIVKLFL